MLILKLKGTPSSTVGGLAGPVLLARRSAVRSLIAAPPSLALLLARLGSSGLSEAMVAVFVALPALITVVSMSMAPSSTLLPGAPPLGSSQVTVCPTTLQVQPLPAAGTTASIW